MNFNDEGWKLEFQNGVEMNGSSSEHVKEASVISQYCDIIAIRAFASLNDKEADERNLRLRVSANTLVFQLLIWKVQLRIHYKL